LKSLEDAMSSLDMELELDPVKRVVTLHMLEFDSEHIASFLSQSLPHEFGVRIDDSLFERVPALTGPGKLLRTVTNECPGGPGQENSNAVITELDLLREENAGAIGHGRVYLCDRIADLEVTTAGGSHCEKRGEPFSPKFASMQHALA
jgi:hypothetical protein